MGAKKEKELVLIVDDVRVNRVILQSQMSKLGLKSITASTGVEAVERYQKFEINLVLMDVNMPEMGGIEATRIIKKLAGDKFIPVIFITGTESLTAIRCAIEAGGDDFIQHPFAFELLEGKIIALQRIAKLYRHVNELNKIREHEVEVAEQLLSRAVESDNVALDQVNIYKQPAETFSGDVQLTAYRPNGDLNILLGDFTGHGLISSFGALPLAEIFRAMTEKGYDIEEIIAQINRKLYKLLPTGLFLATGIVTITVDGSARIWNGGIPDIMLFSNGELVKRVPSDHPPLGILANLNELIFTIYSLKEDDHIVMISDGVIEAQNHQDEMFGEERFLDAIRKTDKSEWNSLVENVLVCLRKFMKGAIAKDDISLIDIPANVLNKKTDNLAIASKQVVCHSEVHDVWNWSLELQGQSLARINPVAQALSRLQESEGVGDRWNSVFSILTELYVNALDHGVLKLDSSIKESEGGFAEYFSEREKRLEALDTGSVSVYLQHIRLAGGGRLQVHIDDSGDGFDYQYWLKNEAAGNTSKFSGRGIQLVSELCESILYYNGGATVEVVYAYSAASTN